MEKFDLKRVAYCMLILCFTGLAQNLKAQVPNVSLDLAIESGIASPMQIVHAGDGSKRIFIVERAGTVKVFAGTRVAVGGNPAIMRYPLSGTFLNLNSPTARVGQKGEGGLLSIAFHPNFKTNGYVFVYYTEIATSEIPFPDLVLARYTVSDPASNTPTASAPLEILRVPHPLYSNHYGSEMHFGKDGFLYISTGDGGSGGDPNNHAQNITTAPDKGYLLGKMLRIDVNNASGAVNYTIPAGNTFANEVFDYGLRNPWRWSFDRLTGDMWIGDVGQELWEEIDFRANQPVGGVYSGGVNFGWNCFEGTHVYANTNPNPYPNCGSVTNTRVVTDYDGQSVVGGVVYRGPTYTRLKGYFLASDYFSGDIRLIKRNLADTDWDVVVQSNAVTGITDIGEDENGEVFATVLGSGRVYQIISDGPLPVRLAHFKGTKTTEGVKLSWETSSEENFRMFEIEYSSTGKIFEKVGSLLSENPGKGAGYQFFDPQIHAGDMYYRLKMIDNDNSYSYSRIISIGQEQLSNGNFVQPSFINSGNMHVTIDASYKTLELVGQDGRVLLSKDVSGMSGVVDIPVSSVASGIYLVRLEGSGNPVQQKVLVTQ